MNYNSFNKRRAFCVPHEQGTTSRLKETLARVNVRFLCEHVYKSIKRGDCYFSPIRDDGQNPAFAIRQDGEVAIDHGTGEGFNAITLILRVENLAEPRLADA